MKPVSAFMGFLFSIVWLAALAWVTPYLADAVVDYAASTGDFLRVGLCFLVAIISAYWLFVGVAWTFEDLTGKHFRIPRPRWLR